MFSCDAPGKRLQLEVVIHHRIGVGAAEHVNLLVAPRALELLFVALSHGRASGREDAESPVLWEADRERPVPVGERAGTLPGTENVPACGARAYGGGPWDSIGEPRNAGTILLTES